MLPWLSFFRCFFDFAILFDRSWLDYTVTVNLSGNGNSVGVTGLSSITTAVDTGKPAQPTFDFVDTGSLNNDGITNNGLITINNLEMNATWQVQELSF